MSRHLPPEELERSLYKVHDELPQPIKEQPSTRITDDARRKAREELRKARQVLKAAG